MLSRAVRATADVSAVSVRKLAQKQLESPSWHVPVMSTEVVKAWAGPAREASRVFVDCTVGHGGHSLELLAAHPAAAVVGIDVDAQALAQAEKRLKPYSSRVKLYHSCFTRLDQVLEDARVGDGVDGVFADLGLLRSHSELANRGFSYKLKGRLDMRYDPKDTDLVPASVLVNRGSRTRLREIFQQELDPEVADRIAQAIVAWRGDFHQKRMVHNTLEFRHIIDSAVSEHKATMDAATESTTANESSNEEWAHRRGRWLNRARREREVKRLTASKAENPIEVSLCFQALRRYVNKDSERLQLLSQSVMNVLKPSGAFAVLSYETADSDIIAAGVGERGKLTDNYPMRPSPLEIRNNSRARSVRLYRYEPVRGYSTSARKPALGSGSSDRIAEAMKRAVKQREVEQKTTQQEAVVGFGDGLDPHQAKLLQEMNELLRQPDTPKNREKAQELLKQAQKFQRDLSKPKRAPPAVKTPAKPDNATHKKKTVNVPLATVTPKLDPFGGDTDDALSEEAFEEMCKAAGLDPENPDLSKLQQMMIAAGVTSQDLDMSSMLQDAGITDVSKMDIKLPRKLQEAGYTFESLAELNDDDFVKAFETAGVDPNKMYSDDEEGSLDADLPPELLNQLQSALRELDQGDALLQSLSNGTESVEEESATVRGRVRGRKAGQTLESGPDDDKSEEEEEGEDDGMERQLGFRSDDDADLSNLSAEELAELKQLEALLDQPGGAEKLSQMMADLEESAGDDDDDDDGFNQGAGTTVDAEWKPKQ